MSKDRKEKRRQQVSFSLLFASPAVQITRVAGGPLPLQQKVSAICNQGRQIQFEMQFTKKLADNWKCFQDLRLYTEILIKHCPRSTLIASL